MPVYTIQPSFSGGEFSPSLYSRIDVQKYSTALKTARNFIIHPHGGASNRPGMQFIKKVKTPSKKTRVIPFEFSLTQKYILEFGENYIRFIKDDGYVLTGLGATYEIATTYAEADLALIKYVQSADVLFLFHPNYKPKRLTRYSDNNWVFDDFPFVNGPFMAEAQTMSASSVIPGLGLGPPSGLAYKGYSLGFACASDFFEAGHVGSLIKINQHRNSASLSQTITGNIYVPSDALMVKGTWRLITRGTWAGALTVLKSHPDGSAGWDIIKTLNHASSSFENYDITGSEDELCRLAIGMDGFGGGTCNVDLSCDSFEIQGVLKITSYTNAKRVDGVVVSPFSVYETITSWHEGAWSTKRGYPSCGAFYQDRLVTAATPAEGQAVWTSKTGNYVDFGTTLPLEDTDAVSVNLPSRKMNAIKSLIALNEILALTSASECGVSETGGVFSPSTVKTRVHGYRGTSGAEPAIIGNRAILVQSMGSVVRDFGYDFSVDGFTGSDLSIFSSHLFKGYSIVEMAYQQEPDSLVWFVRSDGKLLSMTYMKEQEVIAWSWHETDGLVESICSIPGDGQNDVYIVVNRGGSRNIEKLGKRLSTTNAADAFFLDSALTYSGAATTIISGLTHLAGKTVNALADGNVVKNLVVSGGGSITLPVAASKVTVGLPYISDLCTLKIQVPFQDGSSYGRLVKVAEAQFTFLNSRGGFIGPDADNLDELIELSGSVLGAVHLYSGEYKHTMASGYDPGGSVLYRQTDPLPVTILSIQPKITVGG